MRDRPYQHLRRRRGFTLLEVLLALALFAFSGLVLASAYVNILDSLDKVRLDQSLEDELALVRTQVLLQPELEAIEEGGEVPTLDHGMARWSAVVTPSERVADLFRVELAIELEGRARNEKPALARQITQSLWLLRPDWSEPTERDAVREERRRELADTRRKRRL